MGLSGYTHPTRSPGIKALNMAPLDRAGGNMWYIPREENAPFHVALLYKLHVAHGILGQMWVGIG